MMVYIELEYIIKVFFAFLHGFCDEEEKAKSRVAFSCTETSFAEIFSCSAILWLQEAFKGNSKGFKGKTIGGYRILRDDSEGNPRKIIFCAISGGSLTSKAFRCFEAYKGKEMFKCLFSSRLSSPYAAFVFLRLVCGWTSG
jgi:hypothetical protein